MAQALDAEWFYCSFCEEYLLSEPDAEGDAQFVHSHVWHPMDWYEAMERVH